jgi:hypothetical protein
MVLKLFQQFPESFIVNPGLGNVSKIANQGKIPKLALFDKPSPFFFLFGVNRLLPSFSLTRRRDGTLPRVSRFKRASHKRLDSLGVARMKQINCVNQLERLGSASVLRQGVFRKSTQGRRQTALQRHWHRVKRAVQRGVTRQNLGHVINSVDDIFEELPSSRRSMNVLGDPS